MDTILNWLFHINRFQWENGTFTFSRNGWWTAAGAVAVIVLLFLLFRKGVQGLNLGEKIILLANRVLFVIILFFILTEPVLKVPEKTSGNPYLVTLIDSSASMSGKNTTETIKNTLRTNILERLKKTYRILIYQNKNGVNIPVDTPDKIRFDGYKTDISSAIVDINADFLGEPVSAFIFISDGIDNTTRAPERKLKSDFQKNVPFFTVGAGYDEGMPEAGIEKIESMKFAAVSTGQDVTVWIRKNACEGKRANLVLKSVTPQGNDKEILKKIPVDLGASKNILKMKIEVPVTKKGMNRYRLVLEPDFDDLYPGNNVYEFYLKGLKDDKIDVLFFSGRIDWEYKFLKETLEDDKRFAMTSILRVSDENNYVYTQTPERVEFKKFPDKYDDIKKFDIIILNEVKTDFLSQEAMENIIKAVNKGKGLMFFPGRNTFSKSGYIGSTFEKVLPVYLNPKDEKYENKKFRVRLSPESRNFYPIKKFIDKIGNLPEIRGYTRFHKIKPGAIPLLVHNRAMNEYGPLVIMAYQRYGQGRVLVSATNSTWQWDVQTGKKDTFYRDFWASMIGYMTPSEEKTIEVSTEKYRYHSGERLTFHISNRYNIEGKMKFKLLDGNKKVIQAGSIEDDSFDTFLTGEGSYYFEVIIEDGERRDRDVCAVSVDNLHDEITGRTVQEDTLKKIAEISGGRYFSIKKIDQIYSHLPKFVLSDELSRAVHIWDTPFFFICLMLFLVIEWILRRRWGLI